MKNGVICFTSLLVFSFFLISESPGADFNVTTPTEFQDALTAAGTNGEADTINVAAGTYSLTSTLLYEFKPAGGEQYPLTITGAGAGSTIIDGGAIADTNSYTNVMRFDYISESPGVASDENCNVEISGLTFQNGSAEVGGGIYFYSYLADITIHHCSFNTNTAESSSSGGGLYASSGVHHYSFTVYARDSTSTPLASATIVGTYEQP